MSSLPRNIGCPPKYAAAPSEEILVLVDLLLKSSATNSPCNGHVSGLTPAFISFLWCCALLTRDTNSGVVKSAMEIKWRMVLEAVMEVENVLCESLEKNMVRD